MIRITMTAVTYLSLCTAVISETVSEQDMYRYAFRSDAASLDPHGMLDGFTVGFLQQIYEPLVRFSTDMAVEPALAEKWDWISPTQLRLQLRRNVVFHDGSPFAADDVLFSIDRAKAEGSDLKAMLGSIERAEKVDDHTVDLHMSYTDPVLLKTLASFSIMDREWSETHATLSPTQAGGTVENYAARHANGTGPYRVIERRQDVNTVLEKNSTWWGGPAYMSMPKAMEFSPVSESMAALAALRSGQLDLAYPIPPHLAAQVEKLPDVDLRKATDLRTMFLGFDFTSDILRGGDGEENPFRNRLVRQAVYMGIDRMALHRVTMQGLSRPTGSIIAPAIDGYDPDFDTLVPADPKLARALLAEAGYPDGFTTEFDCSRGRFVNDDQICQAVAGMLRDIGIDARITLHAPGAFYQKIFGYDTDFYLLGVAPPTVDVITILRDFAHTRTGDFGAYNVGGYANPALDALTAKVATTTEPDARQTHIAAALKILHDETVFVPLHQQLVLWGVRTGTEVTPRPDNVLMPWTISVSE